MNTEELITKIEALQPGVEFTPIGKTLADDYQTLNTDDLKALSPTTSKPSPKRTKHSARCWRR